MKFYVLIFLFVTNLTASVTMGKEVFSKECATCHVQGKYFASHKKAKEWSELFKNSELDKLHLERNISVPYLQEKAFFKDIKHLKELLQKYSKDRGSHNSCY